MKFRSFVFVGASLLAYSAPVAAQERSSERPSDDTGLAVSNEIVVSARRREETLQEVPQTVNVVTAEQIEKLNIRNLTDVAQLVPGLTLSSNGSFSTVATVRGVAFNVEASGNNPTVEFYLNDTPIASNFLLQSTFDVGQFELLRGPQGTLRGRAAPSGSITLTTRRPDLTEVGAVANATLTSTDTRKFDGALNIPIIENVFGIRIAGVVEDTDGSRVRTVRAEDDPTHNPDAFRDTRAIRVSARLEPTDWLSLNVMGQHLNSMFTDYAQVQSASLVTGEALTGRLIRPYDRLAINDLGGHGRQDQRVYVWNADVRFAGQKLSYSGSHNRQAIGNISGGDPADYFAPPRFPVTERAFNDPAGFAPVCAYEGRRMNLQPTNGDYFQCVHTKARRDSHEIRLASEDRIAGIFDYVVGGFYDRIRGTNSLTQETPLLAAPTFLAAINLTPIVSILNSDEKSVFGSLTAHFGGFELTGGLRYIDYHDESSLDLSGARANQTDSDYTKTVYSASAKYRFSPNLMIYATTGTSWRPGVHVVGNFSARRSPREESFINLNPETSTSYEAGVKASFLDGRGAFNLSVYQQDFKNYVYRGPGVFYVSSRQVAPGFFVDSVATFNFVSGVPVRVRGVEAEASFQIAPRWGINANFAYSDGKIKNGTIACTDLNGDGVPDINPTTPTLAQLQAAVGAGQNVAQCSGFSSRANFTPKWNATIQSEAGFSLTQGVDAFVRALATYTPSNGGDPRNTFDDTKSYALINLFAGINDPDRGWEVSFFAKNLLNKHVVLGTGGTFGTGTSRQTTSLTTLLFGPGGSVVGSSSSNFAAPYFPVSILPPRELGVTVRIALGAR